MWLTRVGLGATRGVAVVALLAIPAQASSLLDEDSLRDARTGLDHLYHDRTEEAVASFERIRSRDPESPATDFLLGGIEWHLLTTGPAGYTSRERELAFFGRMDAAIEKGEAAIARNEDDVTARFFAGGAYGYKARYLALQEKWWDAYRTGRHGVKHLEYLVENHPEIADAYLGLGIYHYYADVLPSVLKFLAGFVGMSGDREKGLREIRRALRDGELVEVESRFFLAEIYSTFEEDQWRALEYSGSLRDDFPENELFLWINARVLDELHLADRARAEWTSLLERPRNRIHRGFLRYRLARATQYGGDFAGAAEALAQDLEYGRLGSRRISMWGRLRYGLSLDFLGRHEEAMFQYELARRLDASESAKKRANERLSAGKHDPSIVSLGELEEVARILRETAPHPESTLRDVEELVTRPGRGLSRKQASRYFSTLLELAWARLRGGDLEACRAAVNRALAVPPPKEARADFLELRARAFHRQRLPEEALADLRTALPRAAHDRRDDIRRVRRLVKEESARNDSPSPGEAEGWTLMAPDRGEIRLEVEIDPGSGTRRFRMTLADGRWIATIPPIEAREVRYRFVADDLETRVDPGSSRIVLVEDVGWSIHTSGSEATAPPD